MSPWLILGIEPTASPATVRAAYRRAVFRWHPDGEGAGDVEQFMAARKAYKEILELLKQRPGISDADLFVQPRTPPPPSRITNENWDIPPPATSVSPPRQTPDVDVIGEIFDVTSRSSSPPAATQQPAPTILSRPERAKRIIEKPTPPPVAPTGTFDASSLVTAVVIGMMAVGLRAITQSVVDTSYQLPLVGLSILGVLVAAIFWLLIVRTGPRLAYVAALVMAVAVVTVELFVWAVVPISVVVTGWLVRESTLSQRTAEARTGDGSSGTTVG